MPLFDIFDTWYERVLLVMLAILVVIGFGFVIFFVIGSMTGYVTPVDHNALICTCGRGCGK